MTQEKKAFNWRTWAVGALIAQVVIVALQSSEKVRVDILFVKVNAPLIVILLVAVAVGALIGYVTPVLLRHRRDERGKDSARARWPKGDFHHRASWPARRTQNARRVSATGVLLLRRAYYY